MTKHPIVPFGCRTSISGNPHGSSRPRMDQSGQTQVSAWTISYRSLSLMDYFSSQCPSSAVALQVWSLNLDFFNVIPLGQEKVASASRNLRCCTEFRGFFLLFEFSCFHCIQNHSPCSRQAIRENNKISDPCLE